MRESERERENERERERVRKRESLVVTAQIRQGLLNFGPCFDSF